MNYLDGFVAVVPLANKETYIKHAADMAISARNIVYLWYDREAEQAARFYASVFPDSKVKAVHHAPSDYRCKWERSTSQP